MIPVSELSSSGSYVSSSCAIIGSVRRRLISQFMQRQRWSRKFSLRNMANGIRGVGGRAAHLHGSDDSSGTSSTLIRLEDCSLASGSADRSLLTPPLLVSLTGTGPVVAGVCADSDLAGSVDSTSTLTSG